MSIPTLTAVAAAAVCEASDLAVPGISRKKVLVRNWHQNLIIDGKEEARLSAQWCYKVAQQLRVCLRYCGSWNWADLAEAARWRRSTPVIH
jgi:hypothetical protein